MKASREMEIISKKRNELPLSSDEEHNDEHISDISTSDFEETKTAKPRMRKRRKTARKPDANQGVAKPALPQPKIPPPYQSDANVLFSKKWYCEVGLRDEFWADFVKKMPKSVISKRMVCIVNTQLNGEAPTASTVVGAGAGAGAAIAVGGAKSSARGTNSRSVMGRVGKTHEENAEIAPQGNGEVDVKFGGREARVFTEEKGATTGGVIASTTVVASSGDRAHYGGSTVVGEHDVEVIEVTDGEWVRGNQE